MSDLRSAVKAALADALGAVRSGLVLDDDALLTTALSDLWTAAEELVLADRASQLADERQEFLDRAAIRIYARGGTSAVTACDWSEALWAEREKRRLVKTEEVK